MVFIGQYFSIRITLWIGPISISQITKSIKNELGQFDYVRQLNNIFEDNTSKLEVEHHIGIVYNPYQIDEIVPSLGIDKIVLKLVHYAS